MDNAMIFEDEYQGPRFVYGLNIRPAATYNIPNGRLIGGDHTDARFPLYGTVTYPRQLTDEEIRHYSLTPLEA